MKSFLKKFDKDQSCNHECPRNSVTFDSLIRMWGIDMVNMMIMISAKWKYFPVFIMWYKIMHAGIKNTTAAAYRVSTATAKKTEKSI